MKSQQILLLDESIDPVFWKPPIIDERLAWSGHTPFAQWLVASIKPRVIVELGTHSGVSYTAFCNAVARLNIPAKCYAVDTWKGDEHAGFYDESIYQSLNQFNAQHFGNFSTLIRSTFDSAVEKFSNGSIDLLHIDGLHTYESVQHDFETWRPKLSDRAVVLLHDTNEHSPGFGVWRYWNELSEQYPAFNFHHNHGLGVLCYGKNADHAISTLANLNERDANRFRTCFQTIGERWLMGFLLAAKSQKEEEAIGEARASRAELHAALDRIDQLQSAISDRDFAIRAIHNSTSWRITAPMRAIFGGLRRSRESVA